MRPRHRLWALPIAAFLAAVPLRAQFPITLQQRTIQEFDAYAQKIETQLAKRWHGQQEFLAIDGTAGARQKVLNGEISIRSEVADNPVEIFEGLIHDWTGDVFLPNISMGRVLSILQDFDRHAQIYPETSRSRLLQRTGNHFSGYWRLEKKDQILPVVLDAIDEADYEPAGAGKWICRAYAKDIREVENAGNSREKKLPLGRGRGFLWRLYGYWSLEAVNGGVLAECRTLSLSRSVPPGFGWAVKPVIKSLPRESLTSTLRNTRSWAAK